MPAAATPCPCPAVDAYIEKSAPFAQPVLKHLRELIHTTVPGVEETIKWSMPFFLYKGIILAHIAAFKAHCSFDIPTEKVQPRPGDGAKGRDQGMGSFGKLISLKDLPPDRELTSTLLAAAGRIDRGERRRNWEGRARKERPAPELPEALAAGLRSNTGAAAKFAVMSPSCRREYCAWIADARREQTRARRVEQALEMIAAGKGRNWKYETC